MSDENKDNDQLSVFAETDDQVGYKQPPKKNRFKKGRSGNDKGRPKGARNKAPNDQRIDELLLAESQRLIEVKTDGSMKTMTTLQAIVRSINLNAIKGNPRAQRHAVDMASNAEARRDEQKKRNYQAAVDYIDITQRQIAEAKRKGLPRPYFAVDPDDIHLDPEKMEATYDGRSHENVESLKALINYRAAMVEDIKGGIEYLLEKHPEIDAGGVLHTTLTLQKLEKIMGDPFVFTGDDPYNFDAIFAGKKKDKG